MRAIFLLWPLIVMSFIQAKAQNSFVKLENGQTLHGSKIRFRSPLFSNAPYLEIDGTDKVSIEEVDYYVTEGMFYKKGYEGYSTKPAFFLREDEGKKISLYSKMVTYYSSGATGYNAGLPVSSVTVSKLFLYNKDNEQRLKKMTIGNLKSDLMDDIGAMELLKKARGIAGIQAAMYVVGTGLVIAGIADSFNKQNAQKGTSNNGPTLSPLWIAGAITFVLPLTLNGTKRKQMRTAIDVYNR